ncbi:MAG: permease prefix domain 1-containing protein, partial [Dehalococcoidia bacterium]|nr:permease prefix domain 1-containing protein [Dehalococcoidia bacterium]
LETVRASLKLDPAAKQIVLRELRAHFEDKWAEMKKLGFPDEVAVEKAIRSLGSPKVVAQQLLEVYGQGTWRQAIVAAMPHLIVAWLLAIRVWQGVSWVSSALIGLTVVGMVMVVICGWWHGKPTWVFPWLGYYMLPVIAAGILIVFLPDRLNWIVGLVYIPLAVCALYYIIRQTLREDWLLATLMLLPMPVVFTWVLMLGLSIDADADFVIRRFSVTAPSMALSFIALAVMSATFIRGRQRRVKIAALVVPQGGIFLLLALTSENSFGLLGWLLLAGGSLVFLLMPRLLEHRIGK